MTSNPTTYGFLPLHLLMDGEGRVVAHLIDVDRRPFVPDVTHLRSENAGLRRKVAALEIEKKWLQRSIDQHKRAVQEEAQKVLDMEAKVEVLQNLLDNARIDKESQLAWIKELKRTRDKLDRLNAGQAKTIRELWERDSRKDAEIDALHSENAKLADQLRQARERESSLAQKVDALRSNALF